MLHDVFQDIGAGWLPVGCWVVGPSVSPQNLRSKANENACDSAALAQSNIAHYYQKAHNPVGLVAVVNQLLAARVVVGPEDHVAIDEPARVSHVEQAIEQQELDALSVVGYQVLVVNPREQEVKRVVATFNHGPQFERGNRAVMA